MDIDSIGIGVETREVKQASKELDKLGSAADKASRKADDLTNSSKKLDREQRNLTTSTERAKSAFSAMSAVLPVLGFAALARAVIKSSDTYTKFNAQLRVATTGQAQFNEAQKEVVRIAQVAQVEVGAIGSVYARFSLALKDAGTSQAEVSRITETLSLALKVNGATAEESSSAMLQLSQAFGKGKLDGDEFRTAMEAMPNVMRELAKSMGVPFGALKDLAEQGAITSDVLVKAFTNPDLLDSLRQNAKDTETIGGAWTNVTNALTLTLGKMADFIKLAPTLNKAAKTFAEAFSAGGLFGGKTEGQQRYADQQEINRLEKILNTGSAGLAGMTEGQVRAQINALRKRSFGLTGNSVGSGALDNFTGAPNFGSGGIFVEDVRKVHERQKELERELTKTKKDNLEDVAQKQFEIDKRAYEAAQEMLEANKEYADKLEKEKFETRQKWLELEQKRANENFKAAQEANDRFEQDRRREAERTSDVITRSLTDALLRGFESGKSFAENFIDTLKNMFRTLVLQPVVKFLVDASGISKVLGVLGGAFSGGASASTGGTSITGLLGGIKDTLSSLNGSLVSSIENLGAFLSTGNGGLGDIIGGALGQYSNAISQALPYAGAALQLLSGDFKGAAFTGVGTAIGSAFGGPVGGAIGSIVGKFVGGLFGGEDYDRFGTTVSGRKDVGQDYRKTVTGIIYDKPIAGVEKALDNLNKSFSDTLSSLFTAFDVEQRIGVQSGLYQRGKSKKAGGLFTSNLGGRLDVVMSTDNSMKQIYDALVNKVFGKGLVKAIKNSELDDSVKKFFDGLTKKEDVLNTVQTLVTLKASLKDLPAVFEAINFELNTTLFKSNAGQITARFQAIQQYTNLFYSDAEKLETAFKQLTTQFGAFNYAVPSSRDEFRSLIDNFNVFDEASANTFYGLVSLAPALDAYYNALSNQKDILEDLSGALDPKRFSTYADFVSAQATISNGGNGSSFMARINNPAAMSQVMAEEIKALRAENAEMKVIFQKIADNTAYTARTNKQWNGDGLPAERTY